MAVMECSVCVLQKPRDFFLFLVFHVVLMLNEDNVYSVIVLQNCCHFFFSLSFALSGFVYGFTGIVAFEAYGTVNIVGEKELSKVCNRKKYHFFCLMVFNLSQMLENLNEREK